eukprot:809553-Alexandrium_andersonii.AAC.1
MSVRDQSAVATCRFNTVVLHYRLSFPLGGIVGDGGLGPGRIQCGWISTRHVSPVSKPTSRRPPAAGLLAMDCRLTASRGTRLRA